MRPGEFDVAHQPRRNVTRLVTNVGFRVREPRHEGRPKWRDHRCLLGGQVGEGGHGLAHVAEVGGVEPAKVVVLAKGRINGPGPDESDDDGEPQREQTAQQPE